MNSRAVRQFGGGIVGVFWPLALAGFQIHAAVQGAPPPPPPEVRGITVVAERVALTIEWISTLAARKA